MERQFENQVASFNMASAAGLRGSRFGLTKATAIEYADKGVRINAVAPAVIVTPMAELAIARQRFRTCAAACRPRLGAWPRSRAAPR